MFTHKAREAADLPGDSQKPIDIDVRPWVVADIPGRAVASTDGIPVFRPDSDARYRTALGRCVGKDIRIRILRPKERRSIEANAYLWGVVYVDIIAGLRQLAEDAGEHPVYVEGEEDELHEAMKWKFLRRRHVLVGREIERPLSSAKLSPQAFAAFVDEIIRWAAELGIYVRRPHEVINVTPTHATTTRRARRATA